MNLTFFKGKRRLWKEEYCKILADLKFDHFLYDHVGQAETFALVMILLNELSNHEDRDILSIFRDHIRSVALMRKRVIAENEDFAQEKPTIHYKTHSYSFEVLDD